MKRQKADFKIFQHDDPMFEKMDLTVHEQTSIRGKPISYLKYTIELFLEHTNAQTIVEVGSVRSRMQHDIHEFHPSCCNDGHSTYFWKEYTNAKIYTVDINPSCKQLIDSDTRLHGVISVTQDAIEYLRNFHESIDLLFLDAWDVAPGSPFSEKHLEAYTVAKDKLAKNCFILIDDTDVFDGGKGKLLIPKLVEDGFVMLMNGRQTLFARVEK